MRRYEGTSDHKSQCWTKAVDPLPCEESTKSGDVEKADRCSAASLVVPKSRVPRGKCFIL